VCGGKASAPLYGLDDIPGPDTTGAHITPDLSAGFHDMNPADIGTPDFARPFIRVAYIVSKLDRFSTDITFCHEKTPY
jgi:hypothetical protein